MLDMKWAEETLLTSYSRNNPYLFVLANHDAKAQLPSVLARNWCERQRPRAVYDTSLHLISKDLKKSSQSRRKNTSSSHLKVQNIFLPPQKETDRWRLQLVCSVSWVIGNYRKHENYDMVHKSTWILVISYCLKGERNTIGTHFSSVLFFWNISLIFCGQ